MVDHQINLEDVRWAYRLLLDRDPESGEIAEKFKTSHIEDTKQEFFASGEKNVDIVFETLNRNYIALV